jgi:la-related protein 1
MAATTTKPEMPAFSYAQAAKGLSTTATSQQPAKSSTDQAAIVSHREESNNSPAADESANSSSTQTEVAVEKGELGPDSESKSATTASSKNVVSGTSSPSFGTASTSTLPKEDDISVIPNGTSDSTWDKQSQASVPLEKPNAAGEVKKEEASNPPSEKSAPVKELKAAPIPAVNVWQQRKEAQEAKAKANAAALKSVAANASKLAPVKPANVGQQTSGDIQDPSKPGSKKKTADGQTDATGSQGKDRRRADTAKSREDGKLI